MPVSLIIVGHEIVTRLISSTVTHYFLPPLPTHAQPFTRGLKNDSDAKVEAFVTLGRVQARRTYSSRRTEIQARRRAPLVHKFCPKVIARVLSPSLKDTSLTP